MGSCLPGVARPLCEARIDSSHGLDVFGRDDHVEELELELPIGEVVDQSVFSIVFVVVVAGVGWDDGVVHLSRVSAEVGGSVEALALLFFFAAMWSCQNEPRVGAKIVGVGYSSERRLITTTQIYESEASRENGDQDNSTKIKA